MSSDDRLDSQMDLSPRKAIIQIDDAISKTKFGLFNYVIICVSAIILYAVTAETSAIVYVIPVSQCDLNLSLVQKGVLASSGYLGIIFSSHLWGFLADMQGRRRVIQPTLFMAFIFTIVCSFVENFYIFTALRFLNGFFMSCASGTAYVYLGEFHNNVQRSRAIMSCAVLFTSLCIIMPLTAWAVINLDWSYHVPVIEIIYSPWRFYMILSGLPAFGGALALFFLPENPKFVLGQGDQQAAYAILQKMNRWNTGSKSPLEFFEIHEEAESVQNRQRILECKSSRIPLLRTIWNQTAPLFKSVHMKSTLLICIIQFGISLTSTGFFMFFAEILNKMSNNLDSFTGERRRMCEVISSKPLNMNTTLFNEVNLCVNKLELSTLTNAVLMELIFAVGSVLIGLLINRIRKFWIIFFICVSTGLGGIGCMLTDIPILEITFFLTLLSCGLAANVISTVTVDLYPTALRAMALSVSYMFARVGAVTGSNTAAFLLDNYCETTFYLSGSILIAMSALAFFIPNIHNKVSSTESGSK